MAQPTQSRFTIVRVMNRTDLPIRGIQFDGEEIAFEPLEVKHLTSETAQHVIKHSAVKWDPVTEERIQAVVEWREGAPEPELIAFDGERPAELLERRNLPSTHFDDDGNPLPPEVKNLQTPTAMMRGRIPGGAGLGVPGATGAAGTGLGAKEPLPEATAQAFRQGIDRVIERAGEIAPQEAPGA